LRRIIGAASIRLARTGSLIFPIGLGGRRKKKDRDEREQIMNCISGIEVRPAVAKDLVYIDSLQRANLEALSFYPRVVFEREIENSRIVLALLNSEPAGYLYHGAFAPVLKIHQACIQYDARGHLYGAQLVSWLINMCQRANVCSISLRCGSDIAANAFWKAMGFHCQAVTPGGVRRMRDINNWRLDVSPQLFVIPVDPSDRKQDASLWRRHKDGTQSQFMRGDALKKYRQHLEAKANSEK
jgi:hypothetical protein